MKTKTKPALLSGPWLLAVIMVGLAWYFGQMHPIQVQQDVPCSACRGSGRGDCARCQGFGTVETLVACPKCSGSGQVQLKFGNNPRPGPCNRCGGKGQIAGRRGACPVCHGAQKGPCQACAGRGRVPAPDAAKSVVMGLSPWDRLRRLAKLPVDRNPKPWRWPTGAYPLAQRALELRAADQAPRVVNWGPFEQTGNAWRMVAEVEMKGSSGPARVQPLEFVVQNRVLIRCQCVP